MRAFTLVALLALAGCSWDQEKANIFVEVDGIPATADHLDVTFTPSDTTIQPSMYRPSFQPGALASGSLQLAFAAPSTTGTFTLSIEAGDMSCPTPCTSGLAAGTTDPTAEPTGTAVVNLQVTLH